MKVVLLKLQTRYCTSLTQQLPKPRHQKRSAYRNNPYLLGLLDLDLTGSPGDNIQVDDRVQDQQEVHGGNGQEVNQDGKDTLELLRMQDGRYDEGTHHAREEDGRRTSSTVLSQLQGRTHKHCHHDQGVRRR